MRKQFLLFFAAVLTINLYAQTSGSTKTLKKVMTLKMPLTVDDDMPGTRGASVIWHSVQKKYYAAFAGNMGYPLAVFDATGKRLSSDSSVCLIDVRGLWYNPDAKEIQGNAYNDNGWFNYILDATGKVKDYKIIFDGMNQPDAQSVGTYNSKEKKVLFLHSDTLHIYNSKDATPFSTTAINWERMKLSSPRDLTETNSSEDYNYTSLIYTGIKNAEIGFLNISEKQIELYDYASCHLSKVLTLPNDARTEAAFNFSYANGIYWLFDMDARTWYGYK